jgi:hypothetical protein
MVVGYHLIWTAYGWWLPNDPRGSSSHEIRVERIAALGELHHGRQRVQPSSPELRRFYEDARAALKHELLTFSAAATSVVAEAFAAVVAERGYTCYACAIMPDHVHALIRRHRERAEEMIARLQQVSRAALIAAGARRRAPRLGRAGVEGVPQHPGRHGTDRRLRPQQPGQGGPPRSGVVVREAVFRVAAAPGAKREQPGVHVSRAYKFRVGARATLSTATAASAAP